MISIWCLNRFFSAKDAKVMPSVQSQRSALHLPCPCNLKCILLFMLGLNKRTTSEKLQEEFSKFGEVVHARVVTDRGSGYSKGFGFVKYSTLEDAEKGMKGMDAQFIDGWVIFAEYARPREIPGQSPSPETRPPTET
ncbi:hypothetical protein RJ639_029345 [Escallonia herrerae]|uniref:RRM domain-containing protein n=1 Tax=Escallonia herrerae TaxID=1293975 RepID=A0AA88XAD0_9ASTE|nr:hypothetical protein RJ639_029345 [Escallonia herrerae]